MQRIGLIGGTGWVGTLAYYERINRIAGERRGGLASTDMAIRSLDFSHVFEAAKEEGRVEDMMGAAAADLAKAGATIIGVCSVTGHLFSEKVRNVAGTRFVAIDDALADGLAGQGVDAVWLLGLHRTVKSSVLSAALARRGIEVRLPGDDSLRLLDAAILAELERGIIGPMLLEALESVETDLRQQQATNVVLACTELSYATSRRPLPFKTWDTVEMHCEALLAAASAHAG